MKLPKAAAVVALVVSMLVTLGVGFRKPVRGPLVGEEAINTGAFACGPGTNQHDWINDTGTTLRIRKISLWGGMSLGGKADYHGEVRRISDFTPLIYLAWDHYGDPNAPHEVTQSFAPDWVELAPGDGLRLLSRCHAVGGSQNVRGHHRLVVWWVEW